jgi:hypothetical protein
VDAGPDAGPDAEPDAEPDAGPDAHGNETPATEPGQRSDADCADPSSTVNDTPEPDVETAVLPDRAPRVRTRRYSDISDDDRDVGWGETPPSSGRGDDWYLRERPPHHG